MTDNVKAIQEMLLHRLAKQNGKHSPEMLKRISYVVNCERVVINDPMIYEPIIFDLTMKKGYVQIGNEQEECKEKCIYFVKYGY